MTLISRYFCLGVANQVQKKSRESIKRCQSVEVLSRQPLLEKPPPLPPKKLDQVLNSENLANDNIKIEEKTTKDTTTTFTTTTIITEKIFPIRKTDHTTPTTVIASLRKHHYRRRSAGLLFGVEEKELPAPDTVKETRKIFEKSANTSSNRHG